MSSTATDATAERLEGEPSAPAAAAAAASAAQPTIPQPTMQRARSKSATADSAAQHADAEGKATSADAASVAASSSSVAAAAASPMDSRPCEEIRIENKRTTLITDAEIQTMLYEHTQGDAAATTTTDDTAPASALPSRIASLQVKANSCSILPASLLRLQELNSLSVQSNRMELMEDDAAETPRLQEEEEEDEPDDAAAAVGSTSLVPASFARSARGLSGLKNLHTLELVHTPPAPLTGSQLPSSLTQLLIRNFDVSERSFFTSQLANLQSLSLQGIQSLRQLPDSVSVLQKLEKLSITDCKHLTQLPQALLDLPALSLLDLRRNSLWSLPEGLDRLSALRELNIKWNRILVLPRVFKRLQDRGCRISYDEQLHEQQDEQRLAREKSSVIVEELPDVEGAPAATTSAATSSPPLSAASASSSAAAAAASAAVPAVVTPTHAAKSKRKHQLVDELEEEATEEEPLSKHARSAAHSPSAPAAGAEPSDADASPLAAAAAAANPALRLRPAVGKRRLDDSEPSASSASASTVDLHKKTKADPALEASRKYALTGELSYTDAIPDGFVDPGRHSKLFADEADDDSTASFSLEQVYSMPCDFSQRETVLVDEARDVRLKQIMRQARLMLKQQSTTPTQAASPQASAPQRSVDELQLQVKLLACLVSDSFGGRVVVFAPQQSFAPESQLDLDARIGPALSPSPGGAADGAMPPAFLSPLSSLYNLCHSEVSYWKRSSGSNLVLLCSIQHGLCRHRSLLFKFLVDRLFHPSDVSAKLVRGFREGGIGHAWNVVKIRGRDEWIIDTLDSPMIFRPLSSLADPSFAYFPAFAESSSSMFQALGAASGMQQTQTLATFRDLHLARRGRIIGEGAYSQVFEAHLPEDAATSNSIALKVTQIAHLTPAQFSSLLKEIRLLPHLQHPNIVQFYGYIIRTKELRLFMELVRGANLDTVIKCLRATGQRLTVEDIVVIMLEVSKGMQYLHRNATLHRDLKSAQILLGHPALCDQAAGAPTAFAMPARSASAAHPERTKIKVKRKPRQAEAASAAASSSSSAAAAPAFSLPPPFPSDLSFFSSASIKLCDFNISCVIGTPPSTDESDVDPMQHTQVLEYVGTLRWCAPEVFRAASTPGSSPANSAEAASSSSAAAAAAAPAAVPVTAAARLLAGQRGDCWSLSMVLLELLTLRLPYEDVPTEADLNAKLTRGERSEYQSDLDERCWGSSVQSMKPAEVEQTAANAWATITNESTPASSLSSTRSLVYQSLVGLYLRGTAPTPADRPTCDEICEALKRMHTALSEAKATDAAGASTATSLSASSSAASPKLLAAPAAASSTAAPVSTTLAAKAAPSAAAAPVAAATDSLPTATPSVVRTNSSTAAAASASSSSPSAAAAVSAPAAALAPRPAKSRTTRPRSPERELSASASDDLASSPQPQSNARSTRAKRDDADARKQTVATQS